MYKQDINIIKTYLLSVRRRAGSGAELKLALACRAGQRG